MGVRATLNAITFTTQDLQKAAAVGTDLTDMMNGISLALQEIMVKLQFLSTDILTPAGDATNAATFATEITALS